MKENEIHIISMAVSPGNHALIGWTRSDDMVARILRRNFMPQFKEMAKTMGVVSFFKIRSVSQLSTESLNETIQKQVREITRATKTER